MRQLWVRLSLAFGAVVFISFALVALLSVAIIRVNAENSFAGERVRILEGLSERLAAFYTTNFTWDGVSAFFEGAEAAFPARMFPSGVVLLDSDSDTIYGTLPEDYEISATVPISVNDAPIGTLLMAVPPAPRAPLASQGFWIFRDLVRLDDLLVLLTLVGGIMSVLFGILISRWMTTPLHEVAQAAHDIGEGQLDRHVQEMGTAEVKMLAEAFNRMVDKLHNAELLRRNLVADVAHELRTPITALQANLYAILDDAYPMTKTEIAGLYEQTRTLSRLVTDLHEIAQAEAQQLPMRCVPADLGQIVEEITSPFSVVAESRSVAFEVSIHPGLPYVAVDKQRVAQVINNLMSNAFRHTPDGGKICVEVEKTETNVQVIVSDTGEGIAPEHLPHIFDRFYRVDSGRSRDMGGTGLGLAIVKAIASAHGGTAYAASEKGHGTRMVITFPLNTLAAKPDV